MSAIQLSNQKLWPILAVVQFLRDNTSFSTSRDSIGNTRKTAFENYCKTLNVIQRSDQKLWPFSAFISVSLDKTTSSTSRDSIGNTRETVSGNYCKKYDRDPTVATKVMALFSCYSGRARQYLLFNE